MTKMLIRLAALTLALVLCVGMLPGVHAEPAEEGTLPQDMAETAPEEKGVDWNFMLTGVLMGVSCILFTMNRKRRG